MKLKMEKANNIFYLGSRRGYWTGVLDLVGSMKSLQENTASNEGPYSKRYIANEMAIDNILIFSYVLDKAQDIYPDANLFTKTVNQKLDILTDICVKEIEFSNEEFRDEYAE